MSSMADPSDVATFVGTAQIYLSPPRSATPRTVDHVAAFHKSLKQVHPLWVGFHQRFHVVQSWMCLFATWIDARALFLKGVKSIEF